MAHVGTCVACVAICPIVQLTQYIAMFAKSWKLQCYRTSEPTTARLGISSCRTWDLAVFSDGLLALVVDPYGPISCKSTDIVFNVTICRPHDIILGSRPLNYKFLVATINSGPAITLDDDHRATASLSVTKTCIRVQNETSDC